MIRPSQTGGWVSTLLCEFFNFFTFFQKILLEKNIIFYLALRPLCAVIFISVSKAL